jgi:hypothetical protein
MFFIFFTFDITPFCLYFLFRSLTVFIMFIKNGVMTVHRQLRCSRGLLQGAIARGTIVFSSARSTCWLGEASSFRSRTCHPATCTRSKYRMLNNHIVPFTNHLIRLQAHLTRTRVRNQMIGCAQMGSKINPVSYTIYTANSFCGVKAAVAPDDVTTINEKNKEVLQEPTTELFMCTKDQLSLRPRPPLWSSGQSSWLQIRRPGFDSRHYQIFWIKKRKKTVVGLERDPLSLVSTSEELLDRKVAAPV